MTLRAEILTPADLHKFQDVVLRQADVEECLAGGFTPYEAICGSVTGAWESYSVYAGEDLIAMWGYFQTSPMGEGCGLWLLSTPAAENYPLHFARESFRIVNGQLRHFPILFCYVHAEHERALAWLKWLGFEFHFTEDDFYVMVLRRV